MRWNKAASYPSHKLHNKLTGTSGILPLLALESCNNQLKSFIVSAVTMTSMEQSWEKYRQFWH